MSISYLIFKELKNLTQHFVLEDGGADRDRTDDLLLAKQALSQLSYSPLKQVAVGPEGIEPSTSRLSSVRSNQLSYEPKLSKLKEPKLYNLTMCEWPT